MDMHREVEEARGGSDINRSNIPDDLFFKVQHAGDRLVSMAPKLITNTTNNIAEYQMQIRWRQILQPDSEGIILTPCIWCRPMVSVGTWLVYQGVAISHRNPAGTGHAGIWQDTGLGAQGNHETEEYKQQRKNQSKIAVHNLAKYLILLFQNHKWTQWALC